jgi:hypothetical protein
VIDEADAVAPQKPQKGEERMLGAAEDIVRRGGQRGIGCTLVSQRSAVLNKNVLTQAQILVALRTIAPQDLDAMKAWIDVHGSEDERRMLMSSLPSLPVGDAWFWSPGWPTVDGIFRRVHVLPIETFDSGATPEPGKKRSEPKAVAEVDIDALRKHMAATIEKAKADDPRELRKRIAELERQVRNTGTPQSGKSPFREPKVVEKPVVTDAQLARLEKQTAAVTAALDRAASIFAKPLGPLAESCQRLASAVNLVRRPAPSHAHVNNSTGARSPVQPRGGSAPRPRGDASDSKLPPGEKATLIAAAQYPDGLTREQASILTGYKRSSRDAYIQRLVGRGYVEVASNLVVATEAGVAALGEAFEPLPTGEALRSYWLNRLPPGEKAVLEIAIEHYPHDVLRERIDQSTGYKRSSRDAYIQRLISRRLLSAGRGTVRATEVLFE